MAAFRAARPAVNLARTVTRTVITTFGTDFATASMEFDGPAPAMRAPEPDVGAVPGRVAHRRRARQPAAGRRRAMSRAAPKATAGGTHERSLAEIAYEKLKAGIFDFELLPGDRFSETDIAGRLNMSRTPVRDALYRLEREGYLQVHLRVGWSVRPYDFEQFGSLRGRPAAGWIAAAQHDHCNNLGSHSRRTASPERGHASPM